MNYIGMIFSFMIPGGVIGYMIAAIVGEAKARRSRKKDMHRDRIAEAWYKLVVEK